MFNKAAVQHLSGSDLIHGWSSFSLPALTWAKRHSIPFVLERSSSHMLVQCQLLQEEYLSLGLTWPATHPKIVEQELAEYDLADRIAVPSLFVKRSFLNQGIAEQHLIHNPFGTNLKSFPIGNKQDNIFRVIYVGSLSIRKGIHYLLQAFNQANIPSSELLLVGGATKNTPKLLADADERVRCTGHVPQHTLFNYYQQSTVFVMASLEEGLAYVQAQAMASGLPLICTTNTGGEDLLRLSGNPTQLDGDIEEYPAGYLVPIRNSQAISVCLQLLAQNPKLLRSKRGAALTIRESDLSWGSYAARAMEFYREILN
jgi:glycosyltransferase involved in cell wall biosynthesis